MPSKNIFWIKDIIEDDVATVGEKAVRFSQLLKQGVSIPDSFAITSHAFDEFIRENNLQTKANHLILTANHNDPHSVTQISKHIKNYFNQGQLNSSFKLELYNAYKKLAGSFSDSHVKIFLSPKAVSHLTNHNKIWDEVSGEASLIHSIKECWSYNFSEINLINNTNNYSYTKSILVQKVIDPDKSGKIYTYDFISSDKNKIIIKTMLGEYSEQINLVSLPDSYEIDKNNHKILSKEEVLQKKMKKRKGLNKKILNVSINQSKRKKLSDDEINELVKQAKIVEKITYFPQEIDWAIEKGKIYFLHTKPLSHLN